MPPALGLLALAGLLAALARPQVSVAVPAEQASIVLAMDHSGSMQATDVAPSRLAATVAAGERFLDEVPREVRVGGVVFDHRAEAVQAPTRDRAALRAGPARGDAPSGGTATGDALATSLAMLRARQAQGERRPPAAVVLLSDGTSTHGRDPLPVADEAARAGRARLHGRARHGRRARCPTASACRPTPRRCARSPSAPAARAFTAAAGRRAAARSTSGSARRSRRSAQDREVTAAFAGGALAAAAPAAAALSLLWFRRLV